MSQADRAPEFGNLPRISLEQWRALVAVVDHGSYARAAVAVHKSQSAVTYAIQKIESLLGVSVLEIAGRRAVLTDVGAFLVRRARTLIGAAADLERAARTLSGGREAEIWLAVEILFPSRVLLDALARFGDEQPHTRVEVIESVLGGVADALHGGQADLAITPHVPAGFLGERLMVAEMLAVAAPRHPLHRLGRAVTEADLREHRHVLVRDTGSKRDRSAGTVDVDQRWTVSHPATSIEALRLGYGFAWLPVERIREELTTGALLPLPLRAGAERLLPLYLIVADPEGAGPGVRRLAEIVTDTVARECGQRG